MVGLNKKTLLTSSGPLREKFCTVVAGFILSHLIREGLEQSRSQEENSLCGYVLSDILIKKQPLILTEDVTKLGPSP